MIFFIFIVIKSFIIYNIIIIIDIDHILIILIMGC
jgi:hypothetical protein